MKQTDWKILYASYEGIHKRTVHLLSKELGKYLIRESGVYRIHVLPCEKEGGAVPPSAVFVGCYQDSASIRKLVSADEVPEDGFLVKVIRNPENEEGSFVILTARTPQQLFYAAVSFLDDYIPANAPKGGSNRMPDLIFDAPLPEYQSAQTPDHKKRSVFTWGHSINDYRAYIDNMARLRLNELFLWNDYVPLNVEDVISYAHSYGITVVLGYSWGWKEVGKKDSITEEDLQAVKERVVSEYRESYEKLGCDGIYFQSFTERKDESVGGKLISAMVTDFVNDVAQALWQITPSLRLVFGLHATSVRHQLEDIARVDPRIEILWEDCGQFPYHYPPYVTDEDRFSETIDFTKKLLELRGGKGVGLVFKGVMMLDWKKFVYQSGPYVMGENAAEIARHDRAVRANSWRIFSGYWMQNLPRAVQMLRHVQSCKLGEVNLCIAGTFDGGIYLPQALCAQMFWSCAEPESEILRKVSWRSCITYD